MATRRGAKSEAQRFTLEQVQNNDPAVIAAAKREGGAIVIDSEGEFCFSVWIPQEPVSDWD